jgi:hypothetical protein
MAFLVLPLVLEKVIEAVVVAGAVTATAVVVNEVVETTTEVVERAASSSSSSSSSSSTSSNYRTIYEWWCNGLSCGEKNILVDEIGLKLKEGNYTLENLRERIDIHYLAKEPGKPTKEDGYEPPKKWNGKPVKAPDSERKGYPHKDGSVWVPSGPKGHGGPNWEVQYPRGSGKEHKHVYPGGKERTHK